MKTTSNFAKIRQEMKYKKTLSRFGAKQNGAAPVMMDNFVYHYENGVGGTTTDIDNFHPF
jgi:hypothetical protein